MSSEPWYVIEVIYKVHTSKALSDLQVHNISFDVAPVLQHMCQACWSGLEMGFMSDLFFCLIAKFHKLHVILLVVLWFLQWRRLVLKWS
jgi:hypothetical protein